MAVTIKGSQNGYYPQSGYIRDKELRLRKIADGAISTDTEGSDVSAGYTPGQICTLFLNVDSVDYTTGDEEYFVMLEEYLPATSSAAYDGAGYYYVQGSLIKIGAGGSPAAGITGTYNCVFRFHGDMTKFRYAIDVEGTTPSIELDINIGIA